MRGIRHTYFLFLQLAYKKHINKIKSFRGSSKVLEEETVEGVMEAETAQQGAVLLTEYLESVWKTA